MPGFGRKTWPLPSNLDNLLDSLGFFSDTGDAKFGTNSHKYKGPEAIFLSMAAILFFLVDCNDWPLCSSKVGVLGVAWSSWQCCRLQARDGAGWCCSTWEHALA